MTPIQKELYRSILSKCARILRWLRPDLLYPGKNVDILNELRNGAGNMKQHGSRNVKNMLMQLRKSVQCSLSATRCNSLESGVYSIRISTMGKSSPRDYRRKKRITSSLMPAQSCAC